MLFAPSEGPENKGLPDTGCQRGERHAQDVRQPRRLDHQALQFVKYRALGVGLVKNMYPQPAPADDARPAEQ